MAGKRDDSLPEIECPYSVLGEVEPAKLAAEAQDGTVPLEIGKRGFDEGRAQAVRGNERPAGRAATGQRLAHNSCGQPCRRLGRLRVECSEQERPPQPLVEPPGAPDDLAYGLIASGHHKPRERQIIERVRGGYASGFGKDPPRHTAVVGPQPPTLTRRQVGEDEHGFLRTRQLV